MHVIDQLIDIVCDMLYEKTAAVNHVYTDVMPFEPETLPLIQIDYEEDSENEEFGVMGKHCRDVVLSIVIVNRKNSLARRSVMNIRAEVERLLGSCQLNVEGMNVPIILNGASMEQENEAENGSFELTLNYTFTIYYNHGDPENFA